MKHFGDTGKLYENRNCHEYVALEKSPRTNWHLLALDSSGLPVLLVTFCKMLKWQFRSWNSIVAWRKAVSELTRLLGGDCHARHRQPSWTVKKSTKGPSITNVVATALVECWNWRTLLRTSQALVSEHGRVKQGLSQKSLVCWLDFQCQEAPFRLLRDSCCRHSCSVLYCYFPGWCTSLCSSGIVMFARTQFLTKTSTGRHSHWVF